MLLLTISVIEQNALKEKGKQFRTIWKSIWKKRLYLDA